MIDEYEKLLRQYDYAVVDRTIIGAEDWHDELPLQALVPTELESDADRTPRLLRLEPDAPHMERIIDNLAAAREGKGEYLFSCLLAAPGIPPDDMQAHLKWHLVFASRQGKGMLRFYDGRVFPHLLRMLREPTLRALFGPIRLWGFRLQDEWFRAEPPGPGVHRNYWALDSKEFERVAWIYTINQTLKQWQREQQIHWKTLDEFQTVATRTEQALLKARNVAGLHDESKQISFALHELKAHAPWPPVQVRQAGQTSDKGRAS